MRTVSPLSGITPVGSSTSDTGNREKFHQPRQGQVFKAMVAEAKSPTMFILDIGGQKIPAQSQSQLSVGQILKLQVMDTSPQVELKILSDSSNLLVGKSIKLLGNSIDLRTLFASLQNLSPSPLANISSTSRQTLESFFQFSHNQLSGKDGGALLKHFIDRLGLTFEALLSKGKTDNAGQTLKSALLELAQAFKNADYLAENTSRLLSTIELYQLAQLQLDKDNVYIFPLPIPFLEKGYLLVEDHGNNDPDKQNHEERFSLHLTLEGLGNLRIDILKVPEGIYLRFLSDSREKLGFIESFKDDLLVHSVDSPILGISFSQEPLDTAADLLKKLIPKGESLVNTKV